MSVKIRGTKNSFTQDSCFLGHLFSSPVIDRDRLA